MIAASAVSRQAVESYNRHTKASVQAAAAANDNAAAGFSSGRELLNQGAAALPEAELAGFVGYADKRIAMVAISKRADALWLSGKVPEANKLIDAYNTRDASAVELAKRLPASPGLAIANAYRLLVAQPAAAFEAARQKHEDAIATLKTR